MEKEIYTIEKIEKIPDDLKNKIAAAEADLAVLARVVGGDFDMKVEFGKLGGGSYFDPDKSAITLDPEILVENKDWLAEFVAGHEGGHRAITRSLEQIGLKKDKAIELYKKLGFGYLNNCLEDCADNDWVGGVFEKFKDSSDKNYQEQFAKENAAMTTPEINQIIGLLGYTPKFVSFGSEIIRQWATGKHSTKLDESVEKSLKKVAKPARETWSAIPDKFSVEKERLVSAKERFKIIYEEIWPEFEKLVKMDLDQEKLRELAKKMMDEAKKKKEAGPASAEASAGEGGGLPKELQKELDKLAEENMKEQLKELEKQLDELKKELDAADSADKKKEIQEKIKKLFGEKESLENGEKNTVPWDKLSDELKEKLQDIYNKLPKEARQDLEKKAKETLESLDDELIKDSRGKLSKDDKPPTHEELEAIEKKALKEKDEEKDRQDKDKVEESKRKLLKKELDKQINEGLSEYDKIYQEIALIADEFYNRIQQIFLPHRHPRWTKEHPTGQRVDLAKVMQFQADKSLYDKIWQRRTTPEKIDYRFTLLVDLSGSMEGDKIEQTFRGVILMAEVLNRLGIKTKIYGFQDELILYKDFSQDLSPALREEMLIMRKEVNDGGKHNQSAYNSDGYCLDEASTDLQKNKGKDSFLVVFSDGLPAPDAEHASDKYDLNKVIKRIKKNTKQKLIGVGLGPDTEHVMNYYPTALPNLKLEDMPTTLGALLEDMIKYPAKYK